jgi:DNA-directed RNA polymerase specialized sigma24 family protein
MRWGCARTRIKHRKPFCGPGGRRHRCAAPRQPARAWLYRILRNERARPYGRQRPQAWDPVPLPAVAVGAFDTRTEALVLRRALQLDRQYREPRLWQTVGGFGSVGISRLLDLKPKTVLARLLPARKASRATLESPQVPVEGKTHELS